MSKFKLLKKTIATVLVVALAVGIVPTQHLKAAQSRSLYVKEFKLYIKNYGEYSDAEKWCEAQSKKDGTEWKAIKDNLNEGAAGAFKDCKGVFLCYQTTDDPTKAVTDIAVMNERGNYDEGAYEAFIDSQKDMYADMVSGMKTMIEQYRTNYDKKIETAIQAHDMLNGYKEDDSGKPLGDLLLTVSDSDLRDILLQANGEVVIMIENQLALAAETEKSTWLDRMEKLGSFDMLRKQALKAYNNNAAKADNALDKKYKQAATELLDSWPDIYETIKFCNDFAKKNGLDKMNKKEVTKWIKENADNMHASTYADLLTVIELLGTYKYEDATLYEFFNQTYDQVKGDNIKKLYPLIACLNESQREALSKGVSLVQLVQFAADATVVNDYKSGKATELGKEGNVTGKEAEQTIEKAQEEQEKIINDWEKKSISIYEGVDRDLYKGGVAVTSTAENFSKGSPVKWSDKFVDSGAFKWTTIGMWAGTLVSGIMAVVCRNALRDNTIAFLDEVFCKQNATNANLFGFSETTYNIIKTQGNIDGMINRAMYGPAQVKMDYRAAIEEMYDKGIERGAQYDISATSMNWARYLKIGFTVFAIVLCVVNIVMTIVTLVDYYNRDHLPIPHHMVDLSYNEDKETSYVNYKSVLDDSGDYGDLNGGSGKQWLALYQTHEEEAGLPILAPEDEKGDIKVQHKNKTVPVGYSPLHLFGAPNAAQNLTFADGESGWSYNDDKGGTYLFFKRDLSMKSYSTVGSAMTKGNVALVGGIFGIIGLMLGMAGGMFIGKKRREEA